MHGLGGEIYPGRRMVDDKGYEQSEELGLVLSEREKKHETKKDW